MAELPNLISETASLRESGELALFSVSLDDKDTADKIMEVVRQHGIDYPVIYDGGGWDTIQSKEWGVRSIPATYLIDPQGTIVATGLRGEMLSPWPRILPRDRWSLQRAGPAQQREEK